MPQIAALREALGDTTGRFLSSAKSNVSLDDVTAGSLFGDQFAELAGRNVLVATADQLATALTLIELDGVAARLCICAPDLPREQLQHIIASAALDRVVCDVETPNRGAFADAVEIECGPLTPYDRGVFDRRPTEWVLLTSGTLGVPKMMVHTIDSLTATTKTGTGSFRSTVWGSFYDIWRFAGLQVFFQAMLGGGSLVLASRDEGLADYLARLAACKATHLSGTPTQWRRVLMSPWLQALAPHQVTLGGEIVDQAILNNLRRLFPDARITHIYASTEAGVGFAVTDGLAGFPAGMLGRRPDGAELRVEDGTLYLRSARVTRRSIERERPAPIGEDGFVDTGDTVELRGDRYHFLGRRDGVINVGGVKIHPEEVETVINSHPAVRYSRVRARRNPITGSIVVADIVLKDGDASDEARNTELRGDIRRLCQQELTQYQVPATISIVPELKVGVGGKLVRHDA